MGYVAFKKIRLFLILVSILCSVSVYTQNKISVFSDDYNTYLDELDIFMNSSGNSNFFKTK